MHDSCVADLLRLAYFCVHTGSIAVAAWLLPASSSYMEFAFNNNSEKARGRERKKHVVQEKTVPPLWCVFSSCLV